MSENNFVPTDEEMRRKAVEARQKALQTREANDWKYVLKNPSGRRVVWSLLTACGRGISAFDAANASATAYNCALRDVATELERKIREAEPGAVEQMALEAAAEEKQLIREISKETLEEL